MKLDKYRKKRNFGVTPEPEGAAKPPKGKGKQLVFVVQEHLASHLHYDFRLEWRGVLLSWAIPKGPSLDPSVKRLAVPTEDHPLEYANFEGIIPPGEYGAGTVMVWDRGVWIPDDPGVDANLKEGELKFTLDGKKLKGAWVMVRARGGWSGSSDKPYWMLIKHRDAFASKEDITKTKPLSAISGRTLEQITKTGAQGTEKAKRTAS
ncbi:MAG TPA: DNA polymerase ligase N-terminal domain-containing protein [Candidatus Sulfotelmatobacter sp.]|nr:DNA polymerase ligase N-terminal domain-containing protein [Candidatus Sulfotelmatobacter sp.]